MSWRIFMKHLMKLISVLAMVFTLSNGAHAVLSLTLTDLDTTDSISFTDNGTGDLISLNGWLSTIGILGNWTFDTTAYGEPLVGSPYVDEIDLASSNVKYEGGDTGSFQIELVQTGLTKNDAMYSIGLGGTAAGTIQFESYIDNVLISDSGALSGAFSFEDYGMVASGSGPYDYKVVATIVSGLNSTSSFDYNVRIPEPGTLGLMGLGILGMGIAFYARRRRQA
jgi:hypothetical protein